VQCEHVVCYEIEFVRKLLRCNNEFWCSIRYAAMEGIMTATSYMVFIMPVSMPICDMACSEITLKNRLIIDSNQQCICE